MGNKTGLAVSNAMSFEDDLLFDVTVAPSIALAVSTPSPATREKIERAFGEVSINLLHGDCLSMMKTLESDSVDSVVTDPPYGLAQVSADLITKTMIAWATGDREFIPEGVGFMGKSWDSFVPPPAVWDEVYRVLKPGGHVLAFAGSRTQDLMGLSIRLAGFELRDSVAWLYGSGFPKSMDIAKAIDKQAGVREHVSKGFKTAGEYGGRGLDNPERDYVDPPLVTDDAQYWQGWGTALKPAHEPIVMARKPLSEKTVAANVLKHGTGGINIDASRIASTDGFEKAWDKPIRSNIGGPEATMFQKGVQREVDLSGNKPTGGRFPANVIFDEYTAGLLDEQSGHSKSPSSPVRQGGMRGVVAATQEGAEQRSTEGVGYADQGGASRFFYCPKANKSERPVVDGVAHPTVKPLALMRYLAKLVTPMGGTVLEPFAGSGTTVEACILEGFDVVAIERESSYIPLIKARVARQLNGAL